MAVLLLCKYPLAGMLLKKTGEGERELVEWAVILAGVDTFVRLQQRLIQIEIQSKICWAVTSCPLILSA